MYIYLIRVSENFFTKIILMVLKPNYFSWKLIGQSLHVYFRCSPNIFQWEDRYILLSNIILYQLAF